MKPFWIVPLLAGAMLAAAPMLSSAQDNPTATSRDKADPEAAQNQPFMATGLDLKGPPRQFRANETPE
ncbi:MAG TPA: hypothetical protein VK337_14515 [Xanthobacteraceae bacterium]|nr:hypothetical protein [Xanthobacteraceae bacterium]